MFLKERLVEIATISEEEEMNGKEGEGEKEREQREEAMKAMELLTQCLDKIKVGS